MVLKSMRLPECTSFSSSLPSSFLWSSSSVLSHLCNLVDWLKAVFFIFSHCFHVNILRCAKEEIPLNCVDFFLLFSLLPVKQFPVFVAVDQKWLHTVFKYKSMIQSLPVSFLHSKGEVTLDPPDNLLLWNDWLGEWRESDRNLSAFTSVMSLTKQPYGEADEVWPRRADSEVAWKLTERRCQLMVIGTGSTWALQSLSLHGPGAPACLSHARVKASFTSEN